MLLFFWGVPPGPSTLDTANTQTSSPHPVNCQMVGSSVNIIGTYRTLEGVRPKNG